MHRVHSHVPLSDRQIEQWHVFLYDIHTTWVLDVDFSHDASGKYCICEATVGSAKYCKMWEFLNGAYFISLCTWWIISSLVIVCCVCVLKMQIWDLWLEVNLCRNLVLQWNGRIYITIQSKVQNSTDCWRSVDTIYPIAMWNRISVQPDFQLRNPKST